MSEITAVEVSPDLRGNSDFSKLWAAQAVSAFGSRITREGLPYAAVFMMSATPVQMGYLAAAGAVPVLLFGLFAGVWVDRLKRRPILVGADLCRAAALAFVPAAALLGWLTIWHLYAVSAVMGILTLVFDVADRSYLPSLVRRDQIMEANSKLSATGSLAEVGGPALAGLLVQLLTAPIAIVFDALSFLWSALFISLIRKPEARHIPEDEHEEHNVWREIREGLRVILLDPVLRALAVSAGMRDFFGWFFAALYVFFAVEELGLSAGVVGLLVAAGGVGALVGAGIAGRLSRRFGIGPVLIAASLAIGCFALPVPLASGPIYMVIGAMLAAQFFGDIGWEVYLINEVSLRQMVVPQHLLGRANATMQFVVGGAGPVGALAAGALAQATSARAALFVAAIGMLLATVWLIFSPLRRLREV
ncbi:MAG: MFS transporter [Chloroflexota bacterium]